MPSTGCNTDSLTGRAANLISPAVHRPLMEQGCEPNDRDLCHQEKKQSTHVGRNGPLWWRDKAAASLGDGPGPLTACGRLVFWCCDFSPSCPVIRPAPQQQEAEMGPQRDRPVCLSRRGAPSCPASGLHRHPVPDESRPDHASWFNRRVGTVMCPSVIL